MMCLTPLSTIFQLYRGVQLYWWRKPEYSEKPPTCRKSLINFITQCTLHRVHLACVGFELTTLVVIGTDCIGSYKSNYHTITILYNHYFLFEMKQSRKIYDLSSSGLKDGNGTFLCCYRKTHLAIFMR